MTIIERSTLATRSVLGFDLIDHVSLDAVVAALMAPPIEDDRLPLLATPNVDDMVKMHRPEHADLAALVRRARYLLPDGQPVVWASRLLGEPLQARLSGADLLPRWWSALAAEARPTVVVAPDHGVADTLRQRHTNLAVVVAPRLDARQPDLMATLVSDVESAVVDLAAQVVLIGIGFPHQQRLALQLLRRLPEPQPLIALLGGSFDVFTGRTRRAPRWMRRVGLEWAYRLWREPRRLARRYLIDDLAFGPLVWRAWRRGTTHTGGTE